MNTASENDSSGADGATAGTTGNSGASGATGTTGAAAAATPGPATPYDLLGGDSAVRALVDRFYDRMDADARFAETRALHPPVLDGSRDKLYWFLSGWLGGPPLYHQRVGAPMLRARHLPFPIGNRERDQWMLCMRESLTEANLPDALREGLLQAMQGTADWMRNRAG